MNLPNRLTLLRIILAAAAISFVFVRGAGAKFMAFSLFLGACLTDYFDGYIARKNNEITDFGRLMDPVADKILILGLFLAFVEKGVIPAWMVMIIIAREAVITGIRILALTKKKVLSAEISGKHKTVSQMVALVSIFIFIIIKETGFTFRFMHYYRTMIYLLMSTTVAMTIVSGASFMIKNRYIFTEAGDQENKDR